MRPALFEHLGSTRVDLDDILVHTSARTSPQVPKDAFDHIWGTLMEAEYQIYFTLDS
jgi:hypothetical protein